MKRIVGITAMLAVTAVTVAACTDTYPVLSSLAPVKLKYTATLTGANEAPTPVTTTAAGKLDLVKEDSVNILYELSTTSQTDSITMAHIHAGAAGAAGPIMVWFFPIGVARAGHRWRHGGGGQRHRPRGSHHEGRNGIRGTIHVGFAPDTPQRRDCVHQHPHPKERGRGDSRSGDGGRAVVQDGVVSSPGRPLAGRDSVLLVGRNPVTARLVLTNDPRPSLRALSHPRARVFSATHV